MFLIMSERLMIVPLLSVIAVRISWLELVKEIISIIPFHVIFRSLMFS